MGYGLRVRCGVRSEGTWYGFEGGVVITVLQLNGAVLHLHGAILLLL